MAEGYTCSIQATREEETCRCCFPTYMVFLKRDAPCCKGPEWYSFNEGDLLAGFRKTPGEARRTQCVGFGICA